MKKIAWIVLFLTSFTIYGSEITVTPNIPVECKTYSGPIEMVFAPSIKTEAGESTISFLGSFGKCANQEKFTSNLKEYIKVNFWNAGINFPWNTFQGDVIVSKITDKAFKVEVVFATSILFPNGKAKRNFTFTMLHSNNPYATTGATRKSWNLVVTKDKVRIY